MSEFDALFDSSKQPKKKDIEIDVSGNKLKFTANEISYLQRLHLSQIQSAGGDAYSKLIEYSIVDKDGFKMSTEQVNSLPQEYAEKFFLAATEVNSTTDGKTEKN